MTTWAAFSDDAPDLASRVQARFDATGLSFMATIRAGGGPRISPIEPFFGNGDLWLGMMDDARKLADLRRDPRLALHAASIDKNVAAGDAKLGGRAVEATPADRERYRAAIAAAAVEVPPGEYPLFWVDIEEVSFLTPGGDHLVIEWWKPGAGVTRVERR